MKHANKSILGGLVLSVIFLSSCSSLVKKAEPAFDQVNGLAELRLVLDEKYSPQFDNTVSFPLRASVGGSEKELAFVAVSGATATDPNAVVSVQVALENYLSFVGDIIPGHEIVSQLPNGLGALSRLKTPRSKNPFLTATGLWALSVGPQGTEADASKVNGLIYLPVLTDGATLPDKAFFGGVVRLNVFNGNPAYELPAMLVMELTNNGEVFGAVGAFGAGDQSTGEFPGLIAIFELNALKRAAGSDGIVIREVDFSDKDAFVLGDGVNKDQGELMTYFGEMLDGMKNVNFL